MPLRIHSPAIRYFDAVRRAKSIREAARQLNVASSAVNRQIIKLEEWPKDKVPQGSLAKLEDLEGKRCKTRIFSGEPIIAKKLLGVGENDGAAHQIPKGYRAVAVRVDAVSGGGSLILPGDRVDVLVYMNKNASIGINETSCKTILKNISVFAVDTITTAQRNEKDEPNISAKTVNLLVTPEQAQKVTMATELGVIRLVMRSPDDDGVDQVSNDMKISDLFNFTGTPDPNANKNETASSEPNASGLLALINAASPAPPETPAAAPPKDNWKITLMEGSTIREVEFTEDGAPILGGGISSAGEVAPIEEPADAKIQH